MSDQQEVQQQEQTSVSDPDAELKALADAMIRGDVDPMEATKGGEVARGADGKFKGKETPAPVKEEPKEESELDRLLASREEQAKKHAATRDELSEMREREFKKLNEELELRRQEAKQEYERALERTRIDLREKPFQKLRELGLDPKKALEAAALEDDPHYQARVHLERELESTKKDLQELKDLAKTWTAEREQQKEQAQESQRKERIQKMEADFIQLRDNHEEVERLKSHYGRRNSTFLIEAGAKQRELMEMAPGKEIPLSMVLDYMIREMKRELQESDTGTQAESTKSKSNGTASTEAGPTRTLGSKDHSQRRAMSDAEFSKLSPEDQNKELAKMADEMLRSK